MPLFYLLIFSFPASNSSFSSLLLSGKLRPALIAAGALKSDETVDFKSTHTPSQIIETATVETASSIVKHTPTPDMPAAGSRDNVVSSVVAMNQKRAVPNKDAVVSSTVTSNQKGAAVKDDFVSKTVTANQKSAMNAPKYVAAPASAKVPAAVAAVAPVVAKAQAPVKSAKGFYSKANVVKEEDELCPVEEECEL